MVAGSTAILRALQEQLLLAALTSSPLPGQSNPLHFPDLNYVHEQPDKVVCSENLIGEVRIDTPIVILSTEEITERAKAFERFAFLRFRPAEQMDGKVRLTLELHMAFDDVEPLPLGAVTVVFGEVPGVGWQAVEPPAALGY